uniref:Uncharacterized protein n=1 Tax=Sander lucioperca TaxID=283035 RepID=A0A8C9XVD3_SANLU
MVPIPMSYLLVTLWTCSLLSASYGSVTQAPHSTSRRDITAATTVSDASTPGIVESLWTFWPTGTT